MQRTDRAFLSTQLILVWSLALALAFPPAGNADQIAVFGPEDFARSKGKPVTVVRTFSVQGATDPFLLRIENGGTEGELARVSSAVVTLNGDVVAGTSDFNQTVGIIEREVALGEENELAVEVRSSPGSGFTLTVLGEALLLGPEVTIVSPADGTAVNSSPLEVTGTVQGPDSIAGVTVNGQAASVEGVSFSALTELDEGFNGLVVVATDVEGNQGGTAVSVTLDTVPPTLDLKTPAPGQVTNDLILRFAGSVADEVGVAAVEVNGAAAPVIDGTFDELVALPEGVSSIPVRAADLAGNVTELSVDVRRFTVPSVTITEPPDMSLVTGDFVDVSGAVNDPGAAVLVNGQPATLSGGLFTGAGIPIEPGMNVLDVVAIAANGARSTAKAVVFRDATPPRIVITEPADGAVVHDPAITVSGLVNEVDLTVLGAQPAQVSVNGLPAEVGNRAFLLGELFLQPGENLVTATAVDTTGNTATAEIRVKLEPAAGPVIRVDAGHLQTARIGEILPEPLVVRLTDSGGEGVPGVPVVFQVKADNGRLRSDGVEDRMIAVSTDSTGRAAASFTLGTRAGAGSQRVEATATGFAGTAVFLATALPGGPAHLHVDTGDQQIGAAGAVLPDPFVAVVTDDGFNRLAGVPVTFEVVRGGGVFNNGLPEIVVVSDSEGRARARLRLDPEEGIANNVVEARTADDPTVRFATFVASGLSAGDPAATAVSGLVLDNADQPVPGVTVHVRGTALSTRTDDAGLFHLAGAPVGSILLDVDGSTASRPGVWASLDFEMTTVAGRDNTLGRPIHLLPLDVARGISVSETEGGVLTLPELPGFSLEIAPGSVTFPDGSREGLVSATLVHADKVPMVPGFGQQPRFVVTIQPTGALFDPPASLALPNSDSHLPGDVSELYSFDHDLGRFVSIGPAAVSEDGRTITTNPGVGVVKAGWHCGGDPSTTGTPHDCPQCQECQGSTCIPNDNLSCVLPDPCKTNYRCEGGSCIGDKRRILSVDATANGSNTAVVDMLEPVTFRAVAEHEHCTSLTAEWDLDLPEAARTRATFGPVTARYDKPGTHRYKIELECNGSCDDDSDFGAVLVRCPQVKITQKDPDTDYLCGDGCRMDFQAETDPPDLPVQWKITGSPGTENIFLQVLERTKARVLADHPAETTVVTVHAFNEAAIDLCPSAVDDESIIIFVVPESKPRFGNNPRLSLGELAVILQLLAANDVECLSSLMNVFHDAIEEGRKLFNTFLPQCQHRDNDATNSALHAIANCLTASVCGEQVARFFWDAHEDHNENSCRRALLDFENNEVGRQVAVPERPDLCGPLVRDALLAGDLVWRENPEDERDCDTEQELKRDYELADECLRDP